ncbi:hypothetical protein NKH16_15085 [Mesorhizobium sp. M1307]|uniref:hypothetical protein n=1 Tax=Mesorhizobium sp. M1307 TaxID=2957079 RepID=UPI00333C151D
MATGAGRKNCHVAGLQGQCTAPVAPEPNLAGFARNPKHFIFAGMVMNVVVDVVPPAATPAIGLEKLFQHGCGVNLNVKGMGPKFIRKVLSAGESGSPGTSLQAGSGSAPAAATWMSSLWLRIS